MDLLRWIFSYESSPTVLNSIISTLSWNTSGVALLSASERIKYTFITSLVHITYILQFEGSVENHRIFLEYPLIYSLGYS